MEAFSQSRFPLWGDSSLRQVDIKPAGARRMLFKFCSGMLRTQMLLSSLLNEHFLKLAYKVMCVTLLCSHSFCPCLKWAWYSQGLCGIIEVYCPLSEVFLLALFYFISFYYCILAFPFQSAMFLNCPNLDKVFDTSDCILEEEPDFWQHYYSVALSFVGCWLVLMKCIHSRHSHVLETENAKRPALEDIASYLNSSHCW